MPNDILRTYFLSNSIQEIYIYIYIIVITCSKMALSTREINEEEPIQSSKTKQQDGRLTTPNGDSKRGPDLSTRSFFKVSGQRAPPRKTNVHERVA